MDSSERMNVEPEEWAEAKAFFKANLKEIKFRKAKTKEGKKGGHSFVQINGIIYALNNRSRVSYDMNFNEKAAPEADIGAGGFGRIKFALNEHNEAIAIKITDTKGELKNETKNVLKEKRHILGQEKREVKKSDKESGTIKVKDEKIKTKIKFYTAMPYLNSGDLTEKLPKGAEPFVLGLYAMMGIESLHNERYLHRDIKLENFMLNNAGEHLVVLPIDFDSLILLPPGKTSITEGNYFFRKIIGTEGYMAPEVDKKGEYSIASDVYSLGKMLEYMHFPENIYAPMTTIDPTKRGSLSQAMAKVVSHLQEQPIQSAAIKKGISDYESFCKENAKQVENTPVVIHLPVEMLAFSSQKKDLTSNKKAFSSLIEELEQLRKEMISKHKGSAAIDALSLSEKLLAQTELESSTALLVQQLLRNLTDIHDLSKSKSEKDSIAELRNKITARMHTIDPDFDPEIQQKGRKPSRTND